MMAFRSRHSLETKTSMCNNSKMVVNFTAPWKNYYLYYIGLHVNHTFLGRYRSDIPIFVISVQISCYCFKIRQTRLEFIFLACLNISSSTRARALLSILNVEYNLNIWKLHDLNTSLIRIYDQSVWPKLRVIMGSYINILVLCRRCRGLYNLASAIRIQPI